MKRTINLASKIVGSNFKRLKEPYRVNFALTYACNSRCQMCKIWEKEPQPELSTDEIVKVFDYVSPPWVGITGGEPFLRKDLTEIIRRIVNENKKIYNINITTNGFLTKKAVEFAIEASEFKIPQIIITVSIDGPKETHNGQRGIANAFDMAVRTYKELKKITVNTNIKVFIGYTICPQNIGQLAHTIDELKKEIPDLTVNDIHINIYQISTHYYGDSKPDKAFNKNSVISELNWFHRQVKSYNKINWIDHAFQKYASQFLINGKTPLPCQALNASLFIDPIGKVYPCIHYDHVVGDLRKVNYNLEAIWQSDEIQKIQKTIAQNNCPQCWTPCEAYQTILGNIF